jgi:hypothetical protein
MGKDRQIRGVGFCVRNMEGEDYRTDCGAKVNNFIVLWCPHLAAACIVCPILHASVVSFRISYLPRRA